MSIESLAKVHEAFENHRGIGQLVLLTLTLRQFLLNRNCPSLFSALLKVQSVNEIQRIGISGGSQYPVHSFLAGADWNWAEETEEIPSAEPLREETSLVSRILGHHQKFGRAAI